MINLRNFLGCIESCVDENNLSFLFCCFHEAKRGFVFTLRGEHSCSPCTPAGTTQVRQSVSKVKRDVAGKQVNLLK